MIVIIKTVIIMMIFIVTSIQMLNHLANCFAVFCSNEGFNSHLLHVLNLVLSIRDNDNESLFVAVGSNNNGLNMEWA